MATTGVSWRAAAFVGLVAALVPACSVLRERRSVDRVLTAPR